MHYDWYNDCDDIDTRGTDVCCLRVWSAGDGDCLGVRGEDGKYQWESYKQVNALFI